MQVEEGETPVAGAPRWRLGTRGSRLALAQATLARNALTHAGGFPSEEIRLEPIRTTGDRIQNRPLAALGGKDNFVREIDAALREGRVDFAVHSAKDLPTEITPGLCIAGALIRADPADVLLLSEGDSIATLPANCRVGTCSPRRRAQLLYRRPDIEVMPFRGNVETRLARTAGVDGPDATLLAVAGMIRLGMIAPYSDAPDAPAQLHIADSFQEHLAGLRIHRLRPEDLLPAAGQGTIAIVTRADDPAAVALARRASNPESMTRLAAERGFLDALGGDCHTPAAALAEFDDGRVVLRAEILETDGSACFGGTETGDRTEASEIGARLARRLLAEAGPGFWGR